MQAKGNKIDPDNVLVVCQLSGGNDGLNTVVPWADAAYYAARPVIGIKEADVLKLNDSLGFHPSMTGAADLFKANKLAVVQNVGYPNPNRSHFRSMEIWQTANPDNVEAYGWLGKYLDMQMKKGSANPVMALNFGRQANLAMKGKVASVPCFASLADVNSLVGNMDDERMLREVQGMGGDADAETVRKANLTALDAMSELKKAMSSYQSKFTYANDQFGQGFKQVAQLIATLPKTRVIYFSAGGFDTHSNQPTQQANLLKGFSDGLKTFMDEMEAIGKANKVTVLVFSEFGRRVNENASQGTDHGAAAPMFVAGGLVKGGFHGDKPDFQNLDRGDIAWKIDFRQVYATAIDRWMGGDSASIFGRKFDHVDVF
jgi:uncharacterized protein (DUF1501 family)